MTVESCLMTSISSQLKTLQAPSTPSRAATSPQKAAADPKETFSSSAPPPPWAQKPAVESSRAQQKPTEGQKQGMTAGKAVLLGVGCLAAGVGVTAAVMGGSSAAEAAPKQVQTQTTKQEKKAGENLSFLNQIGRQEGGGLKIDGTSVIDKLFGTQREASPQQALNALKGGGNVYFWESQGDQPVTISSFDQLTSVTKDLKERVASSKLEQGVENIKEGLERLGENVKDEIEGIFR